VENCSPHCNHVHVWTFDRYYAESGYELSKAGDDAVTSQDDVLHKGRSATAWVDDD
jgi:hypothetical protein